MILPRIPCRSAHIAAGGRARRRAFCKGSGANVSPPPPVCAPFHERSSCSNQACARGALGCPAHACSSGISAWPTTGATSASARRRFGEQAVHTQPVSSILRRCSVVRLYLHAHFAARRELRPDPALLVVLAVFVPCSGARDDIGTVIFSCYCCSWTLYSS